MKFDLVVMPWLQPEFPSMAVSRLRPALRGSGHVGVDHYANLRWLAWLVDTFGVDGGILHTAVIDGPTNLDMGAWIFSHSYWASVGTPAASELDDDYLAAVEATTKVPAAVLVEVSDHVAAFCAAEAERIVAREPGAVGFTTTFGQTYPSLALAHAIKALAPQTPIVFGGANCDGEMGAGLLRAYPEIDYTLTGESERNVVALCELLTARRDALDVPGLSWRDEDDEVHIGTAVAVAVDLDALPPPDHGAYFTQVEECDLAAVIPQPGVVVETSRGCWWGQKMHCTFCGLNGATMDYRSESADGAVEQIVTAVREHGAPNVVVVDNILDQTYFEHALPALAALDVDLSIFYEIRSDLTADEARALAAAGIRFVQPGIESLGTRTLRLMRKSSTGSKQVQVLRDLHSEDVTVAWNYLYGFPGENWEQDYAPIVEQMANLVHLSAPDTMRIGLQRFSPNFTDPTFGFRPVELPPFSPHLHPGLSDQQVMDTVYRFSTPDQGCTDHEVGPLHAAVAAWREVHRHSSLRWRQTSDGVMVRDRRGNREPVDHLLDDVESAVHHVLQVPLTRRTVRATLHDRGFDVDDVDRAVSSLADAGLLFTDGKSHVALANEARRPLAPSPTARRRKIAVAAR